MITNINQEEFREFVRFNPTGISTEYDWYQSTIKGFVGTVIKDNIDKDWAYLIFAPESNGVYEVQHVEIELTSFEEAKSLLISKMFESEVEGEIKSELFKKSQQEIDISKISVLTIDDQIKKYFSKYPEKLYDLSSRKFEELVASLMEDMGFNVELTQATRDGGKDIIAVIRNGLTSFITYVECKKYNPSNKVGVGIIREVAGVHHIENPHKSMIFTTSFFTKDAIEVASSIDLDLELKDFNNIREILKRYR